MEDHTPTNKKRVRDNSDDSVHDSAKVKRLREDLLGFLDDSDADPTIQDLDSVMKSFEEEIAAATTSCQSSPRPGSETPLALVSMVDLTSESGEPKPNLGYLLEASDDELGLPPSENFSEEAAKSGENELARVPSDSSGADEFWQFDDPPPSTFDELPMRELKIKLLTANKLVDVEKEKQLTNPTFKEVRRPLLKASSA